MHYDINIFGHLMEHMTFSQMYDSLIVNTIINFYCMPKSSIKLQRQIASLIVYVTTMYFASSID